MTAPAAPAPFDRVLAYLTTPQRRTGVGLLRAALGAIIAALYVQNVPWRALFWGPGGMIPYAFYAKQLAHASSFDLYLLNGSQSWFELVFWTGLAVTLLWAAGIGTALTGPLCFAFTWSLLVRNTFIQDAGWNLVRILMIYLLFADTSAVAVARLRLPLRVPQLLVQMRAMVHNAALGLILAQLCVLYATSCFFKITGHKWQDGTALYYVLRSNQFDLSWSGSLIWHSAFLVAAGTYGTLLFQASYPFWIWQRPYKYVVALAALFFHIGIVVSMALPFFSAIMIAAEAALFSDDEYRRAFAWLRGKIPQRLRSLDGPVAVPARTGG